MPITITVHFVADNISELNELMSVIGDNEPAFVEVSGELDYGVVAYDDTPPFGTERSEAFAKAAEAVNANEREAITSAVFGTLRDLTYHIDGRSEFMSVANELARDAWGSAQYVEPPL